MTSSIKHTEACLRAQAQLKAFEAAWPNYCRQCEGSGEIITPGDWVPYGSTNAQLPDNSDPCDKCSELDICPRCAQPGLVWLPSADRTEFGTGVMKQQCPACHWPEGEAHPHTFCECEIDRLLDEAEAGRWEVPADERPLPPALYEGRE